MYAPSGEPQASLSPQLPRAMTYAPNIVFYFTKKKRVYFAIYQYPLLLKWFSLFGYELVVMVQRQLCADEVTNKQLMDSK